MRFVPKGDIRLFEKCDTNSYKEHAHIQTHTSCLWLSWTFCPLNRWIETGGTHKQAKHTPNNLPHIHTQTHTSTNIYPFSTSTSQWEKCWTIMHCLRPPILFEGPSYCMCVCCELRVHLVQKKEGFSRAKYTSVFHTNDVLNICFCIIFK